jgi:hypothetical protein
LVLVCPNTLSLANVLDCELFLMSSRASACSYSRSHAKLTRCWYITEVEITVDVA